MSNHLFSQIPRAQIQRSSFNRSHTYKTALDENYLIPFYCDEVLPGDTFNLKYNLFGRLATPAVPVLDNMYLDTFFFFVPSRLVWDNWQRFNGEQKNPGDSTDYLIPTVSCDGTSGSIYDYFGIPYLEGNGASAGTTIDVNALPFRAYNLIYNEWFRDENLINSVSVPTGDGPDSASNYRLLKRGKRHDYFTSALPWPQKGPGVEIPLGTTAGVTMTDAHPPVVYGSLYSTSSGAFMNATYRGKHVGVAVGDSQSDVFREQSNVTPYVSTSSTGISTLPYASSYAPLYTDLSKAGLSVDLSQATAATINSLRQAFQLQRLYERDARGGSRYTEILRSHFGVVSPDARLQRPEYLGGGSTRIQVNPVAQTSATDQVTPQGNLAAFGLVADRRNGFKKSFVEHGFIIGLCNLRADLNYQQGLNRMWSRQTRFDFYWPVLAHLGEQAILSKEIFADGSAADDDVFGYQERYAEYRYKPNMITGKLRSTDPNSLDVWHLAQKFTNRPVLNKEFIEENVPLSRSIAIQNEPHLLLDVFFELSCVRPMPVYGVPGLVDHF